MARKKKPPVPEESNPVYVPPSWKDLRIPDKLLDLIVPTNGGPQTLRMGSAGHRCPGMNCAGELVWANTALVTSAMSLYWTWCPVCERQWSIPSGVLKLLLQRQVEALKEAKAAEPAPEPEPTLEKVVPQATPPKKRRTRAKA